MKIYFAGSIRGDRDDQALYAQLIALLQTYGEVLTEHVGYNDLAHKERSTSDQAIFERDMSWLAQSNFVVAEVTTPSLGVGYELGQAQALGKTILCLWRPQKDKRLSAMISGNKYRHQTIMEYNNITEAEAIFQNYFAKEKPLL